jgi:two-component system LytT family sensor kinase
MNSKLNKTDYFVLVIFYSVSILLNIIDYRSRDLMLIEYLVDIPTTVITSLIVIIIFMSFLIPKFLLHKKYLKFIVFSLLILSFWGIIADTLGFLSGGNSLDKLPKWYRIIVNGIYTSSNDSGFLLGILFTKKFYENQTELSRIQKQQKENELKLLRSQIDPHFLFNNLNTLDSLIDSNPEKAKEYISRLSLIYRYLIKTKDAEVMELISEIEFAENYIFLMKIRFGEDYEFVIEKNISLVDKYIPTGALQSLLENVVKHNKSDGKNVIKTAISINEGWLIITNSKATLASKNESFGTGLENLKARYQLLSDKKIQVHNMAKKFEVSIPIIELSS